MSDTVVVSDGNVVTVEVGTPTVVVSGAMGPPGINGDLSQAFAIYNKFSEISEDEVAKQAARANLGLATIDGGTFF